MLDPFNRPINYLRISVTDRCNLRCAYCMPAGGVESISHDEILRYEEIVEVVKVAATMGIDKVRITGGEPLVRKGIVDLVRALASIPEIRDLSMTTNGQLLESFAFPLAEAGLHRINISLDAIDPQEYTRITRGGEVAPVFRGIEKAIEAGLQPIKINCVITRSSAETNARQVQEYARKMDIKIRFIRQMNLADGCFSIVEGGDGGDCSRCNRLRLTSNGYIKPCLFNDISYSVRNPGAENAITQAVSHKPACGTVNHVNTFSNIGG
ncbi:MAG: radical SAM protein [Bacteroidetes bacterium]|nr:radical SAM protein [Bacteroidota bacterium]